MNKSDSIEAIDKINLTNQAKFRLVKISKIQNYFIKEISQRKSCSKKLSKYVVVFDYIDKTLIFLSAKIGGVSIISFTSIAGAPVGIISASLTLFFLQQQEQSKNLLNIIRNKKKKHDEVLMLAKGKLSSIEVSYRKHQLTWKYVMKNLLQI